MSRSAKTNKARVAHKIGRELLACYNSHFPFSHRQPPENRFASEHDYGQACFGDTAKGVRLAMRLGGPRFGYVQRTYRAELKVKMRKIERSKQKEAMAFEMRDATLAGIEGFGADLEDHRDR